MGERNQTATSNFGVGKRESHDSTAFYQRFHAPVISNDDTVLAPLPVPEPFVVGDARAMGQVVDGSVALVVTSPPYFVGKEYETELARDGVPTSYLEYLEMLRQVFAECVHKLEPGGRIAVNVANLGRKPYRSLSADVIRILEDDLGLLLRAELIWQKADGASGSCAWGSFRSAANPVIRDITERVIVASKGRFDRAKSPKERAKAGLPHESTVASDDFMALTLDLWQIAPESAKRVGHPAPFPIELPESLIALYTYRDDLVLDPFMGSGSTLAAAAKLQRRYVGFDLDPQYVEIAKARVAEVLEAQPKPTAPEPTVNHTSLSDKAQGQSIQNLAREVLETVGFTVMAVNKRIPKTGVVISLVAQDQKGGVWHFDIAGTNVSNRGGMQRNEVVWKSLGRAHVLRGATPATPLVFLTSQPPRRNGEGDLALRAAGPQAFFDLANLYSTHDVERLSRYAKGDHHTAETGFWSREELSPPA